MKKKNLKNFECYVEPDTTLFQQEVDVIVALVLKAIEKYNTSYGTFILDGQKKGGELECLIRFDLPKGHLKRRVISVGSRGGAINFAALAANPINAIIGLPNWEGSSIYIADENKLLVLNTTYGRFLCSFYANFPHGGHGESTNILMIVGYVIAHMRKRAGVNVIGYPDVKNEDIVLQDSASSLGLVLFGHNDNADMAAAFVRKAFEQCKVPELKSWKAWHDDASNGKLALFFE